MGSKFINSVLDNSKDFVWIEVPFLEKITVKEFEKMTQLDFEEFGNAIRYGLKSISGSSKAKPKNFEEVSKSEIYKELIKIGKKVELMSGDISRISSWGAKDNHPVLIDAGLTKDIFDKFYDS